MNKRKWIIPAGAFISMSFNGTIRTFLGTALPAIRSSLNLSFVEAGTLTAFLQIGFCSSVFIGGPLSDVFNKNRLIMIGCFLMGIGLFLFSFSSWFGLSLMVMGLVGVGGGLIESSSNPLLIQLFPGRETMMMNLLHFFFAAGSLVGPLIMGGLLARSIPWQWGYRGFGLFILSMLIVYAFQKTASLKGESGARRAMVWGLLRQRALLSIFFISLFAIGIQGGIGYWLVTFLKETKGFSIGRASACLSLFWASLAVGRLCGGFLATKFKDVPYLLSLMFLSALFLLAAVLAPGNWTILFFAACGLSQAGVFPSLLAVVGKKYPENQGAALGLAATAGGLGSMVVPWGMSLVTQMSDLRMGFLSFEISIFVAILLLLLNAKALSRPTRSYSPFE